MGTKFAELLFALENTPGQTAKQKEAVKSNITGIGLLIRTNTPEDLLVMIESMV